MQYTTLTALGEYRDTGPARTLLLDSPYVKILQFNLKAGQSLPLHKHDDEGYVSLTVVEGTGSFLAADGKHPAHAGDHCLCPIAEPHGVAAETDMRVLVHIAPPV
ncbi:cupin domain-containing protein [Megalodesulfovibrio gigas]|uniref:Putative cupin 2 barrel domain-containing protein n=1 Tax=Megalodesulfovibrio gigas (strain ATCC 19364 / DSM 1382 / NCIMB 9332 / VKM B-1759) TaxID=1121448 RepID=T2GDE1_MEGG1|nr:cupin domain-containing protein [Megalodesulfovibrio gigas]AGW14333.1 putative cupin 2 barrel domain-containing protein [Megalodesulfovibrio gigas DSM 1382 = ATCC 19364]